MTLSEANAWTDLWVCFESPRRDPPSHVVVLSFLDPVAESAALARWGERCISGRALVQEVRAEARAAYLDLVARLGMASAEAGVRDCPRAPRA